MAALGLTAALQPPAARRRVDQLGDPADRPGRRRRLLAVLPAPRPRGARRAGRSPEEALEVAAATSGRAVLVSGLTVMIAMAGMFLMGTRVFQSLRRSARCWSSRSRSSARSRCCRRCSRSSATASTGVASRSSGAPAARDGESRFWAHDRRRRAAPPAAVGRARRRAPGRARDPGVPPAHRGLRRAGAPARPAGHEGLRPRPEGVPRRAAPGDRRRQRARRDRPAGHGRHRGAQARRARHRPDAGADQRRHQHVAEGGSRADPARGRGHGRGVEPRARHAARRR